MSTIVQAPLLPAAARALHAGERVLISGVIYGARDAVHKRLTEMLQAGERLPLELEGQIIYYAGPCPAKPEQVVGSVGPTTGGRMDAYSPGLIKAGLRVMIGKGERSHKVVEAIKAHDGVYLVAVGGVAALLAECVKTAETIAYEDLGTEAVRRLTVENLPVVVAIDHLGNTI